ncbi:MAG: helix-turn-helix domain-containing protein, partial [Acidimicrobiales bacterium]
MTPSDAATDHAPGDTRRAILAVLAEGGPEGMGTEELAARCGVSGRAMRNTLHHLAEAGLVGRQGQRGPAHLTPAGTRAARALDPEPPTFHGSPADLETAAGHLPTPAHRAFLRLILDAVVGRHHLRASTTSGWPGFIAVGPTKSAKSLLALGALRVLGLDPARHLRSTPAETERSLWGRRQQAAGGAWSVRPAWVLGRPLLALDEWDKAAYPVQRASLKLLQGEALVPGEAGELVEVSPTVMVLGNGRAEDLPPEYRRRSVVLDTTGLVMPTDLHRRAQAFLDLLPVLDLDALAPPATHCAEEVIDAMVEALRAALSPAGWAMADERGLALMTLGRTAWSGALQLEAAMTVADDYVTVAETVGETARPVPVGASVLPSAEARRKADATAQARQRARRDADRAEKLALAWDAT